MNSNSYRSVEDVYVAARTIAQALDMCGQTDAAREIMETITNFWSTSSEALGETRLTLLNFRHAVEMHAGSEMLKLLDEAAKGADDLWHGR